MNEVDMNNTAEVENVQTPYVVSNPTVAAPIKQDTEYTKRMKQHPIWASVLWALALGILCMLGVYLLTEFDWKLDIKEHIELILSVLIWGGLLGSFIFYPGILTIINIIGLFKLPKDEWQGKVKRGFELMTLLLGATYTSLIMSIMDIHIEAEWSEQLYNSQLHQPIWSGGAFTVAILSIIGVIGYLVLSYFKLEKLPPLIVVLSISAMYLGMFVCIMWCVQTYGSATREWILCVFPINCIMIGIKTIRYKILEWNRIKEEEEDLERNNVYPDKPLLNWFNSILMNAKLWPILAFVLMWPLLGILLGILILFGQKPDAMIKAWTETADWRLSQQIAPQNAMYDEHYLCTVAAGGHERIVKPIRMGERHGHRVVVNRQLCIANAFEQILEEKTPRFHRAVRNFYDTYGFPVSKLIRTKRAADLVYIIMKPLEWMFLCVIYLCDVNPENRIAVQYLPKKK